jgi:NADPH-dependent 2,4-dienoyl-CoA reductase/sulfur reductase-like enzyme
LRSDASWPDHQIEQKIAHINRDAIAKVPPLPGAKLPSVYSLRNRDDAAAIVALAGKGIRAVIVGSSFIGLEAASALHERGAHGSRSFHPRRPRNPKLGGYARPY